MTKRLVYLPDPTVKFYYELEECKTSILDLYTEKDIKKFFIEKKQIHGEFIPTSKKEVLRFLIKKFNDEAYDKPYFSDLSNIISHFDVLDIKDT